MESFETQKKYFQLPNLEQETGEFDRVAHTFDIGLDDLMSLAREGNMVELSDDVWNELDNTDSNTFGFGDWDAVHDHSNPNGVFKRDWQSLKKKIESGVVLDAPIIMKVGYYYHLISGNTRLMISRAMGIRPEVFIFDVYDVEGTQSKQ